MRHVGTIMHALAESFPLQYILPRQILSALSNLGYLSCSLQFFYHCTSDLQASLLGYYGPHFPSLFPLHDYENSKICCNFAIGVYADLEYRLKCKFIS